MNLERSNIDHPTLTKNDPPLPEQNLNLQDKSVKSDIVEKPEITEEKNKDPKLKFSNRKWNYSDHKKFLEYVALFGCKWKKISSFIPSKNIRQIKNHAIKYVNYISKQKDIMNQNYDSYEINSDSIEKIRKLNSNQLNYLVFKKLSSSTGIFKNKKQKNIFLIEKCSKFDIVFQDDENDDLLTQQIIGRNKKEEENGNEETIKKRKLITNVVKDILTLTNTKKMEELKKMSEVLKILIKCKGNNKNSKKKRLSNNSISSNNSNCSCSNSNSNTSQNIISNKNNNINNLLNNQNQTNDNINNTSFNHNIIDSNNMNNLNSNILTIMNKNLSDNLNLLLLSQILRSNDTNQKINFLFYINNYQMFHQEQNHSNSPTTNNTNLFLYPNNNFNFNSQSNQGSLVNNNSNNINNSNQPLNYPLQNSLLYNNGINNFNSNTNLFSNLINLGNNSYNPMNNQFTNLVNSTPNLNNEFVNYNNNENKLSIGKGN